MDPKQAEYVEMIERNSLRLKRFVDDLLQVFHLEGNETGLSYRTIELKTYAPKLLTISHLLRWLKKIQ